MDNRTNEKLWSFYSKRKNQMTPSEVVSLKSLIYICNGVTPFWEIKGDVINFNEKDFEVLKVEWYNVVTISF